MGNKNIQRGIRQYRKAQKERKARRAVVTTWVECRGDKWVLCRGSEAESFALGEFATKEEAIAALLGGN